MKGPRFDSYLDKLMFYNLSGVRAFRERIEWMAGIYLGPSAELLCSELNIT